MDLVEFGSVMQMQKGKKPSSQSNTAKEGYLPYVDIKAFETGDIDNYTNDEKCVSCDDGDILIVCDGSRSGLVGKAVRGYVGSTLAKISAEGMTPDYLYYFLQGKYALLNTRKKGTGTPHLNPDILKKQRLIIPSHERQSQIVSRIEELFSELDVGLKTLQKTQDELEVYRQAVYASAFSSLDSKDAPITDFFDISAGLTKNPQRKNMDIKMPYLRVANVYYNRLDLSEIKEIGILPQEIEEKLLKQNDLLFVEGNGSKAQIGRVAIWDGTIEKCVHQNHIIKGRPNGTMLSEYALYYLISRYGREQILAVASSTSGLYTLSANKVRNITIPFCHLNEQNKCIEMIKSRLSVCDQIENIIRTTLQQVYAMRQSILKKAFEGGL